jgi:hypothetical protein
VDYPGGDRQVFRFIECFAHRSMEKFNVLDVYQCGIFIRIEGWFDAMGLDFDRQPDLERCQKYLGDVCQIEVQFRFPAGGEGR